MSQKGVAQIFLPIIAAVGIIAFLLISNTFDFRDQLFSQLFPKPKSNAAEAATLSPRVLVVVVDPVENGQSVFQRFFSGDLRGRTVAQAVSDTVTININAFSQFTHGVVNYQLAHTMTLNQFPPTTNNFQYNFASYQNCTGGSGNLPNGSTCEQQKWLVDHVKWVADNHICETAAQYNADEIWTFSGPYVLTWESFMIGPNNGYGVNGPSYITPACQKHYVAQGCYGVGDTQPSMHCYGHRVEGTLNYVTESWRAEDRDKYWEKFSIVSQYRWPAGESHPYPGVACGNAHWAANSDRHYDYSSTLTKQFNCPDWNNFPNLTGVRETINCNTWGCNDPGWGQHWLGSLPRSDGDTLLARKNGTGNFRIRNNWWYYILYPENTIALRNEEDSTTTLNFSDLSGTMSENQAVFNFTYNGPTSLGFSVEISTNANMTTNIHSFGLRSNPYIIENPGSIWGEYQCGRTLYWRVNNYNQTVSSMIQSGVVLCDAPPPTIDLRVNGQDGPMTLVGPAAVNLSWTSSNDADGILQASGDWSGSKSVSGNETVNIPAGVQRTFTLTALNNVGQNSSDSVSVSTNSVPTPTPISTPTPTIFVPGDINRNGRVDIFDFNLLITDFGKTDTTSLRSDINHNGRVDVFDFNLLIQNFGRSS